MDIFERASRAKLRFASAVGALTTEQLWDLPLKARGAPDAVTRRADLDSVARDVARALKDVGEESFVDDAPDERRVELELKMEIVKHVIASKKADRERAEKRAENEARRKRLLAVLANKEEQDLAGKSVEEIRAEIDKLDAA